MGPIAKQISRSRFLLALGAAAVGHGVGTALGVAQTMPIEVWLLKSGELRVNKYSIQDPPFLQEGAPIVFLYQKVCKVFVEDFPESAVIAAFQKAEMDPHNNSLFSETTSYAVYCPAAKAWYCVAIEDSNERFQIGRLSVAFDGVFALSSNAYQSSDSRVLAAFPKFLKKDEAGK